MNFYFPVIPLKLKIPKHIVKMFVTLQLLVSAEIVFLKLV